VKMSMNPAVRCLTKEGEDRIRAEGPSAYSMATLEEEALNANSDAGGWFVQLVI